MKGLAGILAREDHLKIVLDPFDFETGHILVEPFKPFISIQGYLNKALKNRPKPFKSLHKPFTKPFTLDDCPIF
jgi:hypothetical protein